MGQNETRRHFEMSTLKSDMEARQKKVHRAISKKEAAAMARSNLILLAVLMVLVGVLLFAFDIL